MEYLQLINILAQAVLSHLLFYYEPDSGVLAINIFVLLSDIESTDFNQHYKSCSGRDTAPTL